MLEGNFELLYHKKVKNKVPKVSLQDIREYARAIIEDSQDLERN